MNHGDEKREPEREQPGSGMADAIGCAVFGIAMLLVAVFYLILAIILRPS